MAVEKLVLGWQWVDA